MLRQSWSDETRLNAGKRSTAHPAVTCAATFRRASLQALTAYPPPPRPGGAGFTVETPAVFSTGFGIAVVTLPGDCGQIGMAFCPGNEEPGPCALTGCRGLEADLEAISAWGADAVVTLFEMSELEALGIPFLSSLLLKRGLEWHHLPIPEVGVPDSTFEGAWLSRGQRLREILTNGGRILVHCRDSLGRTGTIAAKLLVEFGFKPSDAIALVRMAHPCAMVTPTQERYVMKLKKWPHTCCFI
jgi:protein-tyrosine phosphatase